MSSRIIIADDHPLFRMALRETLTGAGGDAVIEEASDFSGLSDALGASRDCDLVLLDLNMPGAHGLSGLLLLRAEYPELPVMIVSAETDTRIIRQALSVGAAGYLGKSASPAQIRAAVATVLGGGIHAPLGLEDAVDKADADLARRIATLTPQQLRVLMMLSDGLLNKQIAHALSISQATVKAHVSTILLKLNVVSRTQAVIAAARFAGAKATPVL
jgi:DNA-binding NarL/FixJ family response regulator